MYAYHKHNTPNTSCQDYFAQISITARDSRTDAIANTLDALGRLATQVTSLGAISYNYDPLGRRQSMQVNGLPPVEYEYDSNSRLTRVTQGTQIVTLTYDAANRRSTLTLPNGVTTTYTYDAASRLIALTYTGSGGLLGDLSYSYDSTGSRVAVGGSWARTGIPPSIASTTYDAANRQLTFGPTVNTFDANGNLLAQTDATGTMTYTWDARNRLVGIAGPTLTAGFAYDAFGRRTTKTMNGVSTTFLYDGPDIVLENGPTGEATYLRTLAVDEALARSDASGIASYLTDALGSTVALAMRDGQISTQYTYEPFGQTRVEGAPSPNAFQFNGREQDAIDLYYYRARYYSPRVGRFSQEDPLRLAGGVNFYAYVWNSPLNWIDPFGLEQMFRGEATYYDLPGNTTASGDLFDPTRIAGAMTKEKVSLGTTVTVEYSHNDKNGNTVTERVCVTINDRGPFKRGPDGKPLKPLEPDPDKIIDLTPEAFKRLVGSLRPGKVPVTVTVP